MVKKQEGDAKVLVISINYCKLVLLGFYVFLMLLLLGFKSDNLYRPNGEVKNKYELIKGGTKP